MASIGPRQTPVYPVASLENLPAGHVVDGRYEIVEKIGQGGFGAVYRVFDRKMDIEKALKVLTEEVINDREAMEKLRKEATIMARLNHPNIVRVYDFNEQGPVKYIDMEYVDGKNLKDVKLSFSQKRLPENKARILGRQIARGLGYAHNENVIHRDIKPQNILLSRKSGVKIMDFGISETIQNSVSRVAHSAASGTLVYMAPEQLKGKDVGREADIYSFGALLYDLVSGKPPFYKGDVVYQVLNEQPAPVPHVSGMFNAMLMTCLAKEYTDRYRSFETVYEVLKKEGTSSPSISLPEPGKSGQAEPEKDMAREPEQPEPEALQGWTMGNILPLPVIETPDRPVRQGGLLKLGGAMFLVVVLACLVIGGMGFLNASKPSGQVVLEVKPRLANPLGMNFVYIKPGSFTMESAVTGSGDASGKADRRVALTKGYYMQTTEVTQGQWRKVMGTNPSHFSDCGDDCPVEKVSWDDVQAFIRKLNETEENGSWRLPTEEEWEYACRAGSDTPYAGGNNLDDMGWYLENSEGQTHAVAQKRANAWGLYDMHGNVWEWCVARHGNHSPAQDSEESVAGSAPVLRGGGWLSGARFCRSASHSGGEPDSRFTNLGFRLAFSPEQSLASMP